MGNAGATGESDDVGSLGSVHRSHVWELGAVLWGLAVVSVLVVGRYATIARVQATIQESLVPLVEVIVVVTVFAVLVPVVAR
ncbi:hypothetical protein [Halorubrum sp. Boch-26]|uniref:hypothetical protein n=1 Tax=Halorubrum sp. Boch-26 TaxID=2994426 RepID=UPI0024693785|nr:hypothetical protein [Halorubrum sp. Boch-26]